MKENNRTEKHYTVIRALGIVIVIILLDVSHRKYRVNAIRRFQIPALFLGLLCSVY